MMKFAIALTFLLAASGTTVTPVQKVIQLMNGMVEKGKKEKHEEAVQFATYKQWCDDTTVEKQNAIKEATEKIETLKADIQQYEADAKRLTNEIAKHDTDISTWEGDLKAATKVRETEHADYQTTHKDYTGSINALDEGIATLKKQAHDVKQAAASLVQLSDTVATIIPAETQKVIKSFIEDSNGSDENLAAPEANAYEFQSQGIVDMLTKLAGKFEDERTDLEKAETNAKNAFEMLALDLNSQIDQRKSQRTEDQQAKAKAEQNAAEAKGDMADTEATKEEDTKFLADTMATCEQKSSAFEDRQKLRAEEIEAVEKAIEIMSSDAVSLLQKKHLHSLVQVKSSSLAQLRSAASSLSPNQQRVVAYLKGQASLTNSRLLSALALRVAEDPFKKVKKMIKDLIVKLMEEAAEEAEHKAFCDTELSTNEQTRKEKTEGVETLHAEIDELEASIAKLTEEITELTKAVADLDAAVAKATSIREEEKAKNAATIADAKAAQEAVAKALGVLKDFYEKAGDATALLQRQPEVFSDEPYQGMGGAKGGVVGMIEVIQSDFARLESETSAGEAEAQKQYDEFMTDSSMDKGAKSTAIEHKTGKKQNHEQSLQEAKTDLDGTQKELDAALTYYEKLKPSCVDQGESFEDRVARRKEEIQSLNEALRILSGEM